MTRPFRYFLAGQTVSALGSSFTLFAIPLIVLRLSGSPTALGIAFALSFLPYLLFGLVLGAVVDRVDRKRLMVRIELVRAAILTVVAVLGLLDQLSVGLLYAVSFVLTTLRIAYDAGRFAAVAGLVPREQLITANSQIESSLAASRVLGPLLAGAVVAVLPLSVAFAVDAGSYVLSAISLLLIRLSFNSTAPAAGAGPRRGRAVLASTARDVREGLRYVLAEPMLRNISIMMALVNLVDTTVLVQLVLFAKDRLQATDSQVAWLMAGGGVGMTLIALLAKPLRARFSFGRIVLGSQVLTGLLTVVLGLTSWYPLAVVLWAVVAGLGILFNINTTTLRQEIIPDHLRGRAMSVAAVLAWTSVPVGAVLGGYVVERVGDIGTVYVGIGIVTALIGLAFAGTPLGRTDRYLATARPAEPAEPELEEEPR